MFTVNKTTFLVRLVVLSVLVICSISACGPSASNEMQSDEKPEYGGALVYGKSGHPITLDPAQSGETESSVIIANIFDGLVEQIPGRVGIKPALAHSWDVSSDGKVYTFQLRQGIRFHDGTQLTASSVLFSFLRQKQGSASESVVFEDWKNFGMDRIVRSMEAVDDSTFRITLHEPDATFLGLLTLNFMSVVSPESVSLTRQEFSKNPVGTGPFRFSYWDADRVVLRSNKAYWAGQPYIDSLIFQTIPDVETRWKMMLSGSLDIADAPPKNVIHRAYDTSKVKMVQSFGMNIAYLAMNLKRSFFKDENVRKAIAHAINREEIITAVYGDNGRIAKNPIPPQVLGYNNNIPMTKYDPIAARKFMKTSGYPDGFRCTLWPIPIPREYMPNGQLAAELIKRDLSVIGIDVQIVVTEWKEFLERRKKGEYDMSISGWIGDAPDPHFFFHPLLDKSVVEGNLSTNTSFYDSDAMHVLIDQGRKTLDTRSRAVIYNKACELFNDDLPFIPLAHSIAYVPLSARVRNFQTYASSVRRFNNVWLSKAVK